MWFTFEVVVQPDHRSAVISFVMVSMSRIVSEVKAGSPGAWYRFQVSVDSVAGTDHTVPRLLILQVLRCYGLHLPAIFITKYMYR